MPEKICPVCNGAQWLGRNLPIDHPDFGTLYPCPCYEPILKRKRMETALGTSELPWKLQACTFDSFDPHKALPLDRPDPRDKSLEAGQVRAAIHTLESLPGGLEAHMARIKAYCQEWAQKPEGTLVLLGYPGSGKTHLAAAIVNACAARGEQAIFVVVPDLLDHLRATFSPKSEVRYDQRFDAYRNCRLLALDDLGTENTTPWASEKLYQLVNHRWNLGLPMVVTSNTIPCHLDLRIQSRLFDRRNGRMVELLAGDCRMTQGAKAA